MKLMLTLEPPCKRSVYDVLQHNLNLARRTSYIHRYIYAGEHKGEKEIAEVFTKLVKAVNEDYCEVKITGLLLLYPHYFVHIFDADELTLAGLFFKLAEYKDLYEEIKCLAVYHHVNQNFFDEWGIRRGKPPILLEKINPASDFEELKRYLGICIQKVYNLAIELRQVDPEHQEPTTIGEIMPYMNQYLPEYTLLNYLIHHKSLYSITDVLSYEVWLLDTTYMMQNIWPVRNEYIPYNVFEDEINPVPYLNIKEK